jgi:hypothetical protein
MSGVRFALRVVPTRIFVFWMNTRKDLATGEETARIQRSLKPAIDLGKVEITQFPAAVPNDLIRMIAPSSESKWPHILHFSTHGTRGWKGGGAEATGFLQGAESRELDPADRDSEPLILFAGPQGVDVAVKATDLVKEIGKNPGAIRLVFLNFCWSDEVAKKILMETRVESVIGHAGDIPDESAIWFSDNFYSALGEGESVQRAFDDAIQSMKMNNKQGHEFPTLLLQKGGDASRVALVPERRAVPLWFELVLVLMTVATLAFAIWVWEGNREADHQIALAKEDAKKKADEKKELENVWRDLERVYRSLTAEVNILDEKSGLVGALDDFLAGKPVWNNVKIRVSVMKECFDEYERKKDSLPTRADSDLVKITEMLDKLILAKRYLVPIVNKYENPPTDNSVKEGLREELEKIKALWPEVQEVKAIFDRRTSEAQSGVRRSPDNAP